MSGNCTCMYFNGPIHVVTQLISFIGFLSRLNSVCVTNWCNQFNKYCTRIKGSGEITGAGGRMGHILSSILNPRTNVTFVNISTSFSGYSLQEQLCCLFKTKQTITFYRLKKNTKVTLKLLVRWVFRHPVDSQFWKKIVLFSKLCCQNWHYVKCTFWVICCLDLHPPTKLVTIWVNSINKRDFHPKHQGKIKHTVLNHSKCSLVLLWNVYLSKLYTV